MNKPVCSAVVLLFAALILVSSAQAARSIISETQPQISKTIKINATSTSTLLKRGSSCYYTVTFTTSCTSPGYTRDQISLDFGDAYGNEVYVPRLDDPNSGAFSACAVDTYEIYGPCTYDICYLYVYRHGRDGWRLTSVDVDNYYSFYYNTYIPADTWYGFDYCNGLKSAASASARNEKRRIEVA